MLCVWPGTSMLPLGIYFLQCLKLLMMHHPASTVQSAFEITLFYLELSHKASISRLHHSWITSYLHCLNGYIMLNAYLWWFSIPHSWYYAIVKPLWFLIHGTEPLLTTAHLLVFIASYSEQVYHLPRHFLAFVVPSLSYLDCCCPSYGSHCLIQATITSLWVIIALSWLFVMLAVITDDLSRWFL